MSEPTLEAVRAKLLAQANNALRRPGMYGGESGVGLCLDTVSIAWGAERAWHEDLDDLRERGGFWSTGVTGAIAGVLGYEAHDAMASIYADLAHGHGWLHLDHLLPADEYDAMRDAIDATCRAGATWSGLRERFGEPSILFGGTNVYFPKTLGYASARSREPLICLHLWNEQDAYPEPVLTAVHRIDPGTPFRDAFTLASAARV